SASSAEDVAGLDAPHLRGAHLRPGAFKRMVRVDRAARVFDYEGLEARGARVERGERDAIVGGEPAGENALHAARLKQRAKSGRRLAVRLDESRIGIDARVHALAQDEEGKVGCELGM